MALKQPFALKTVIGATKPELKADTGEAFLIKDIFIWRATASYITVRIEKSTIGYFRIKGPYGSHQEFRRGASQHSHTIRVDGGAPGITTREARIRDTSNRNRNFTLGINDTLSADVQDETEALMFSGYHHMPTLLGYLGERGIFKGFPVAEGQTFTISGMERADSITLILYEIYEPGDISPEMENGSMSLEYFFLNYGNCTDNITTPGDALYNNPVSPAEFPDFPFGKVVPAKYEIDIYGICGSPRAPAENETGNYIYTKFIKLVKEREVLFDEDRDGILFMDNIIDNASQIDRTADGYSLIGNLSAYDNNPPLMFPVPLTFFPGDELNIYLTTEGLGTYGTLEPSEQEITLIEKVRRVT